MRLKLGRVIFIIDMPLILLLLLLVSAGTYLYFDLQKPPYVPQAIAQIQPTETPTPTPTIVPVKTQPVTSENVPSSNTNEEWGKAKQVSEHTWTMKVQHDATMTTAQELYTALNAYRQTRGVGTLGWSDQLAAYAQERADFFSANGLDEHAGFNRDAENGLHERLGFRSLGENSSSGYKLSGVHIIEWVYAGDEPHDSNQIDPNWSSVGVAVSGTATELIFGRN